MWIRIKNLRLRTVIGVHEWERKDVQDIVLNVAFEYDGQCAAESDRLEDTVDYRALTKRIIQIVQEKKPFLLDTLAARVLDAVMEDSRILRASVEIDKPHALRFADSVSVSHSAERMK